MTADVIDSLIQSVVDLRKERDGLLESIKERLGQIDVQETGARELLRDALTEAQAKERIHEPSGHRGFLKTSHSISWNKEALIQHLRTNPRINPDVASRLADELLVTTVDGKAIERQIKDGVLTQEALNACGARMSTVKSRFAVVEPLKR